jgi:formamidopyrimidine-DNA glycosylase
MPELPDVETFKRSLDATSLHQRITDVNVLSPDLLEDVSARELARRLKGRQFESSKRHGKHLFVRVTENLWLRLHFGMTGSLDYSKDQEKAPRHTRVVFVFEKGHRLVFDDQRKFGAIGLVQSIDEFLKKRALGPDALDVDLKEFKDMLRKHRGPVKSVMMNQKLIAGIGNIYVDEILFHARLHPSTQITHMCDKTLKKLFRAMRHILKRAIEAKADPEQMPRSWLLVHRGQGGKCPRCGHELKSATIGGRTAWFCSHCQRCS